MKIENITKRYKNKKVLNGVDFNIEPGECIAILGSNGSGKSTLLSILAGVNEADSGAFMLENVNLLENKKLRNKKVAYVPQGNPLYEELTARDNLSLWYDKKSMAKELAEGGVLNLLGINEFLNVRVKKMSGGMKKRLSIGCAMSGNPSLILLDEPSAALDIACKYQIYSYLKSYLNNGGSIIWVTHDVQDLDICTRCMLLKDGVIRPYGFNGDITKLVKDM